MSNFAKLDEAIDQLWKYHQTPDQSPTSPTASAPTALPAERPSSGRDSGDECGCMFCVDEQMGAVVDAALPGIGGAPTRATTLPTDAAERKQFPVASGFMDYFPDAIVALSNLSKSGSDQHNPGKPLFWDRSKSTDEPDTCLRHFLQRGTLDVDGKRHTVKFAWRALAILQKEIEDERNA